MAPRRLAAIPALLLSLVVGAHGAEVRSVMSELSFFPHLPPDHQVKVKTGLFMKHLFSFDDKAHEFTADLYVIKKWHDGRNYSSLFAHPEIVGEEICSSPGAVADRYVDVGEEAAHGLFYVPEIIIKNADETRILYQATKLYEDMHFEQVTLMKVVVLIEKRDYHAYPFDEQHLDIHAGPAFSSSMRVKLEVLEDASGVDIEDATINWPAWGYQKHTVYVQDYAPLYGRDNDCHKPHSDEVVMDIIVARLHDAGIRIFIQAYLLVIISWGPFWVNPQKLMPRVAMGFISLLTCINFLRSVYQTKPSTPYAVWSDVFEASIIATISSSLILVIMTEYINLNTSSAIAARLDSFTRKVLPINFLVIQIFLYCSVATVSDGVLLVGNIIMYCDVLFLMLCTIAFTYRQHKQLAQRVLQDPLHHHKNAPPLDPNEILYVWRHLDTEGMGLVAVTELRQWLVESAKVYDDDMVKRDVNADLDQLDRILAAKFPRYVNKNEFIQHYNSILTAVQHWLFQTNEDNTGHPGLPAKPSQPSHNGLPIHDDDH